MTRRAVPALAAGAALLSFGCGVRLMTLPSGPGAPADATAALTEATAGCRDVSTLTAEISVRGSIAGNGVRARLVVGLAPPASLRIEAVAPFGQPAFIVVASGGDATVVLSDDRVLEHGPPAAVLDALTGVPLDAGDLRPVLTGCGDSPDAAHARSFGEAWRVVPDGTADVYLRRESDDSLWRVVTIVHRSPEAGAWRAEYREFTGEGLPASVRLTSVEDGRFDLRLALSQVERNAPLGDEVFRVRVPADAIPISIEELRASAPWSPSER